MTTIATIRLVAPTLPPGGARIVDDLCLMLVAMAGGAGSSLVPRATQSANTRVLEVVGSVPDVLLRELGVHRVQFAPDQSPMGRLETMKVLVEGDSPDGVRLAPSSEALLKTYNYPQRKVVVHSTGQTLSLDDVLTGVT